jgi:hypothetical protein
VHDDDLLVRRVTYGRFVELGRAPTAPEVGAKLPLSTGAVLAAWGRLHDQHALVLDSAGTSLRMCNPFSSVPTPHRVQARGRWWYANCAWDAFGICAALHTGGTIETACPDCGDPLLVNVEDERPDDRTLVFHCLVPAARWWEDIVFT